MRKPSKKSPAKKAAPASQPPATGNYTDLIGDISALLETTRRQSIRVVNTFMTATYWEIGRRIVEFEQGGEERAEYGKSLILRLSGDLSERFGRGFSRNQLFLMRKFYLSTAQIFLTVSGISGPDTKPTDNQQIATGNSPAPKIFETVSRISANDPISQTLSAKFDPTPEIFLTLSGKSDAVSIFQTPSEKSVPAPISETVSRKSESQPLSLAELAHIFPLPWSHYVLLTSRSRSPEAFSFYHTEALRGGWSVRQLHRQINSQFYERTALSRNKAAMLVKGAKPIPEDAVSVDEEIRDPLVLEFLNLRDEYSETDLEDALIRHLETFLLELGNDFTFVGRQRRLRVGGHWYRVDLLFFHRSLRCLVIIDLKIGDFTHADAGQMHLYLNYAREHWTQPSENPPVGIILCSQKDESVVHYATDALPNKLFVRDYLTALPDEKLLAAEVANTRKQLERRKA